MNTKFNLEQVFELGQVEVYQNVETIPDVEVTLEKGLDGYPLMYHLATVGAVSNTLTGRANTKNQFAMSIFSDSQDSSSGTPLETVYCSGIFVQSVAYHFPVEGISTEQVTLVGNNKQWGATGVTFTGFMNNTDAPSYSGGVSRRWNVVFAPPSGGATYTILPTNIEGISASGTNDMDAEGNFKAHVQNIRASANLGREQMHELGRRGNFFRYVQFPVEVRTEIEIYGLSGDSVSALEEGINADGTNQVNPGYRITIKTDEGTYLDLGSRNKLETVTYGGGNATGRGGNVMETYSYQTWNDFIVAHPADPSDFGGF
jgi:hypothetical protein